MQQIRQKRYAIYGQKEGFKYVKYQDGKTVWLKDGLASSVIDEKIIDAHGNVSYRNTYNMRYNQKRLVTDYEAEITDYKGRKTYTNWSDAEYTDDSVFYADEDTNAAKKLTRFKEIVIDHQDNITSKVRSDIEYNQNNLMTAYNETVIDKFGNTEKRVWSGGIYNGDKQLIGCLLYTSPSPRD